MCDRCSTDQSDCREDDVAGNAVRSEAAQTKSHRGRDQDNHQVITHTPRHLWLVMIFMDCRLTPTGKNLNIRVFLSSDSTFTITTHMYREVEDLRTGEVRVISGRPEVTPPQTPPPPAGV